MKKFEILKGHFIDPPAEFSPMPFWFWNDELSKEELIRQLHDFHSKGVDGFVIHPRMGLPSSMPYLSETYMDLVEAAVAEAASLGMKVILYDEGMYPSGSACGMVVNQNPEYASRGLKLIEIPCEAGDSGCIPISLLPGEAIVSALAVRKLSDREIMMESTIELEVNQEGVQFTPPAAGDWTILLFIVTPSLGTIRGVHPGQDDGEPDAPLAADLLNPDAVQAFISLTHEKYYKKLSRYFGTTVFAMFTDEPDLLGRGHKRGLKPWTNDFLTDYLAGGGRKQDLPALWFEAGDTTERIRDTYESVVRKRLGRTYYKQLADWCEAHGIGLTGHPASSNDIGLLEHFHIPGQDVVWRYIAPEEGKAIDGVHSTMGKCSSDAARHRGRRRNLNECFGVCGIEGGWSLSADNMKWYLDWLFVRGVNLISPHAFYYSIRDERRDERPPDVGPNNIWWQEYGQFSRYIKRMSWLMTDSNNTAEIAVLTQAANLPWEIVKPLYEHQIEFNYLEEELLHSSSRLEDGAIRIAAQRYKAVLIEDGERLEPTSWQMLERFIKHGGIVIETSTEGKKTKEIGQYRVRSTDDIVQKVSAALGFKTLLQPASASIRISRVSKEGVNFYVIVNEGKERYEGCLRTELSGRTELWYPWTGATTSARTEQMGEGIQSISLVLERRECLVIAIDPTLGADLLKPSIELKMKTLDLSENWRVQGELVSGDIPALSSWTDWDGMRYYSGKVTYVKSFEFSEQSEYEQIMLDLGDAYELVRLWVNGKEIGVQMWKPYTFDIGRELHNGMNELRAEVTNSLANRYDGRSLPSGILGPVTIKVNCRT